MMLRTKPVLAIDKDRKTWHGYEFSVSDQFWEWLNKIDVDEVFIDFPEFVNSLRELEKRNIDKQYHLNIPP